MTSTESVKEPVDIIEDKPVESAEAASIPSQDENGIENISPENISPDNSSLSPEALQTEVSSQSENTETTLEEPLEEVTQVETVVVPESTEEESPQIQSDETTGPEQSNDVESSIECPQEPAINVIPDVDNLIDSTTHKDEQAETVAEETPEKESHQPDTSQISSEVMIQNEPTPMDVDINEAEKVETSEPSSNDNTLL